MRTYHIYPHGQIPEKEIVLIYLNANKEKKRKSQNTRFYREEVNWKSSTILYILLLQCNTCCYCCHLADFTCKKRKLEILKLFKTTPPPNLVNEGLISIETAGTRQFWVGPLYILDYQYWTWIKEYVNVKGLHGAVVASRSEDRKRHHRSIVIIIIIIIMIVMIVIILIIFHKQMQQLHLHGRRR